MSIVNFSDRHKTSTLQKNSVLVKNVFYVIDFYHIRAFPSIQLRYNGVFYVIRYSTLSRGRKHNNTFHTVLMAKFRPDPNESGSAEGLTHNWQNQR